MRSHAKASSAGSTLRRGTRLGLLLAVSAFVLAVCATGASAATLVEFDNFATEQGSGAGQFEITPRGVAINRTGSGGATVGDVYVSDRGNQRVEQYTKDGAFVRAWGMDVDSGGGTGFEVCEVPANCQAGAASSEAGGLSNPTAIVLDQDTGAVYVLDSNNSRISVFSATGAFEGAFGWAVDKTTPEEKLQFCTLATECQAGRTFGFEPGNSTGSAGAFSGSGLNFMGLAIDPESGHVWVGDSTNHRINEFDPELTGETVTGTSFVRALGWNVDATAPAEELQECTTATGCQTGTEGAGAGQMDEPRGIAADSSGNVYVSSTSNDCAVVPCRLLKFNPDGSFAEVFGPDSGGESTCQLNWTEGFGGERTAYWIAIDPSSQHLFAARRAGNGSKLQICEFDDEGELLSSSPSTPFQTSSVANPTFDFGVEERLYLNTANEFNNSWPVTIFGYVPASKALVTAPTGVTAHCATLKGTVTVPKPGGTGFDVDYRFEYSGDNGLTWNRAPEFADASVGTTVPGTYPVSQDVCGLLANATYKVRLKTFTSFVTTSDELLFSTLKASPAVVEVRARGAGQTSLVLEGKIDPNGLPTSYRFEWGPTASYGNQVPIEFEPSAGSGHELFLATANLSGLTSGTAYHYRIVATNAAGPTATADQVAETLNSCGLPEDRCFELVSRIEAGPVAIPGQGAGGFDLGYQAAMAGSGALAYRVEAGYPDATRGAEVLYRGTRGPAGWSSIQLSTPILARNETSGAFSKSGETQWLSDDLSCGFGSSNQPLTDDPVAKLVIENGSNNLYRINPDNSYTLVNSLPSEDLKGPGAASVIGGSQDCEKVVLTSNSRYPGIPTASGSVLYEWDEGTLRNAGIVPGPSGEVPVSADAARPTAVSEDGSRVFFSATRQTSSNPTEIGKTAVFVREDGTTTRDLSLSQTSTPAGNAQYQWATPDGSKVFFTANAGLTEESSPAGTDLYEYDLEAEELTDLSVSGEVGGAQVGGFVAGAADGSRAYFIARAQLVPGYGKTRAQNQTAGTYSLYGASGSEVDFVGTVSGDGNEVQALTEVGDKGWSSRASADGRYLVFQTSADVTGYDSGGAKEAYLYDAQDGSEGTVCVSCRQDGQPSVAPHGGESGFVYDVLKPASGNNNYPHPKQLLTVRNGEPQVFFTSPDDLAPGAVVGQNNIYMWSHDQVFRLTSAPEGQQSPYPTAGVFAVFADASEDGSDAYIVSPENLSWEDGDERLSIYDARIGGGFPEPPPPPSSCDPDTEGSCQGSGSAAATLPGAGSSTFSGPGNPAPQAEKKKKKAKKHKKKHAKKKHKRARHANANRRAGK